MSSPLDFLFDDSPTADHGNFVYGGGNGSSIEEAIVVSDVSSSAAGVRAEYAYMEKHFPGFRVDCQLLLDEKGRSYDKIEFTDGDGRSHTLYFDITEFYGG